MLGAGSSPGIGSGLGVAWAGGGGRGAGTSGTALGCRVSFRRDEELWELDTVAVAQHRECTRRHRTVRFKRGNFTSLEFQLNFFKVRTQAHLVLLHSQVSRLLFFICFIFSKILFIYF